MLRVRLLPWEYGIRNLFRRPARSGLTLVALTTVVLLVLVVVAFIRGLESSLAVSGDPQRGAGLFDRRGCRHRELSDSSPYGGTALRQSGRRRTAVWSEPCCAGTLHRHQGSNVAGCTRHVRNCTRRDARNAAPAPAGANARRCMASVGRNPRREADGRQARLRSGDAADRPRRFVSTVTTGKSAVVLRRAVLPLNRRSGHRSPNLQAALKRQDISLVAVGLVERRGTRGCRTVLQRAVRPGTCKP